MEVVYRLVLNRSGSAWPEGRPLSQDDIAEENQWLKDNGDKFRGKFVAVAGLDLIAVGDLGFVNRAAEEYFVINKKWCRLHWISPKIEEDTNVES